MKRRTDTIVPLIEKICKRSKTFTKHSLMLKLSKLLPDITDDEVRNTINILMQRGTIERDHDQKKGDSKGAVYKVVDKKIIETLKEADELVAKIRDLARDTIKKMALKPCLLCKKHLETSSTSINYVMYT